MSSIIQLHVPIELKSPLFFSEDSIRIDEEKIIEWMEPSTFTVFPYEMAFYHYVEAYRPWTHADQHISFLFTKWKEIEGKCQELFLERKTKQTMRPMKEGIALFFTLLAWMHSKPVRLQAWKHVVEEFPIKPVNLVERLTFIIQRPALYHAFIQLSELFRELEKHYVKSIIKNRLRQ